MGDITLRRYTNLASAIHILRNQCLTLLNPATWDDKNDALFMDTYKNRLGAKSVLALCFAETYETYHHWKVFSQGCDGVCIHFRKEELIDGLEHKGISAQRVDYKEISDLLIGSVGTEELPFIKRYPYRDEEEFRLVHVDWNEIKFAHPLNISLTSIEKIKLSPWMPEALSIAVGDTLKSIDGCEHIPISRSTLVDSERWRRVILPELKYQDRGE